MSCHGLVKSLLFFVNLIFSLIGLGIFVLGVVVIVYVNEINDNIITQIPLPSYVGPVIMIIGTVIFFISFSGCCGAIKEINCLLVMYIIVMLLLAVIKISIAVMILKYKTTAVNAVTKFGQMSITEVSEELHAFEYMTKCCGTYGPESYIEAKIPIPGTCCALNLTDTCVTGNKDIYAEGCKEVVPQLTETILNTATYSFFGIAVFELVSMIAAIYLTCTRRKADAYYDYD